jgi:hypothetical protein
VPEACSRVADLFQSRRVGTAFPGRTAGDYNYQVDWDAEQRAYFIETCEEEMAAWGFEIDFDSPGRARRPANGADADEPPLDRQAMPDARPEDPGTEGRALPKDERGSGRGPVMRLLKWLRSLGA